jgi:hypothetical protein
MDTTPSDVTSRWKLFVIWTVAAGVMSSTAAIRMRVGVCSDCRK